MNNRFISWGLFVLLCFIWGSSFILMKVSQKGLTGPQIAALRIFAAAVVFLPFSFFHLSKIPRKKIFMVILAGIVGNLFPAFCFAIAIERINSSVAGILNSLTPICVVLIGIIFFRDKIQPRKIIGVLVGFGGLCLLSFSRQQIHLNNLSYALLVLAATISYGINVNQVSHYLKDVAPIHLSTVSLSFMIIPTGFFLWLQGFFALDFSDPVTQWAVINSSILGIVGSAFATVLFYVLVQKASGLFASLVTYGIPFVALFWGFMDGEAISAIELLALGIILSGVYLANRKSKKESGMMVPPASINNKIADAK